MMEPSEIVKEMVNGKERVKIKQKRCVRKNDTLSMCTTFLT